MSSKEKKIEKMISRKNFFVQGSRLPIEENTKIEFKNHKLISIEEMSGSGFIPRMAPIRIVFESHLRGLCGA